MTTRPGPTRSETASAALFTGNNLLVTAWADGRIGTVALPRHWGVIVAFIHHVIYRRGRTT